MQNSLPHCVFVLLPFLAATLPAQTFGAQQRLTNAPGSSMTSFGQTTNQRAVAAAGETVLVFYGDARAGLGTFNIYYQRSIDGGETFAESQFTTFTHNVFAMDPAVTIDGSTVHVVWQDDRFSILDNEIWYRRSLDLGQTWLPEVRITNRVGNSAEPTIEAQDGHVHIAWADVVGGQPDAYYRHSADGGATWLPEVQISNDINLALNTSLALLGDEVQVLWMSEPDVPPWTQSFIDGRRSPDGGQTWLPVQRMVAGVGLVIGPTMARTDDGVLHFAYADNRSIWDVYYERSTDNGATWSAPINMSNETWSYYPFLQTDGNKVHFAYYTIAGNSKLYHMLSDDSGLTWQPRTMLVNQSETATFPSMALTNSLEHGHRIHMAWWDGRDDPLGLNTEIYHMRINDPALVVDRETVSIANPADITIELNAGSAHAGEAYLIGLTVSGATPGTPLPGGPTVPINVDTMTTAGIGLAGGSLFPGFLGTLDASGAGNGTFLTSTIAPHLTALLGLDMHFAAITWNSSGFRFASNAEKVSFTQ